MNNLFSRINIKDFNFKNRIVFPPIATDQAEMNGEINDNIVNYYREMAKSGMSLLIVEHNYVMEEGRLNNKQISISKDTDIQGHRKIVNAIHESSIYTALQINHCGGSASNENSRILFGPSKVINPKSEAIPEELTIDQINKIIESFGSASKRVKDSGYDMVEIHSAHGFLINQFLSPITNKRTDKYGGDLNGRERIC